MRLYRQKNSLEGVRFCQNIVKDTLLQTAFSAILPTGKQYYHITES